MSKETGKPTRFAGATHARVQRDGKNVVVLEYVKATRWSKDGDHPKVVRYPVEKGSRPGADLAPKGLLPVAPRKGFALRFGDWVVEDERGRMWVVGGSPVQSFRVEEVKGQPDTFKRVAVELPSPFDQAFVALEQPSSAGAQILAVLIAALVALLAPEHQMPMVFAVTHLMYYTTLLAQWNGSANIHDLDEAADDMQVSAHTNTYTVNQDTHDFFDDVTNEVTGNNYTAGGANIDTQTLSRSTNTVTFDGADVVWLQHATGFSNARKFVVYRNSGAAGTSRLFSVVTADGDVGNVTGDLTLAWASAGIATWTTT